MEKDELRRLDDKLYEAAYIKHDNAEYLRIWLEIKGNESLLNEAVKIEKNKFGERLIFKGTTICEAMLIDYKSVCGTDAYKKLIEAIYTYTDITRLVLDGYANGGYSFLLMSLWNHDLKLTEIEKSFAVSEAMNKFGTKLYQEKEEKYLQTLRSKGITDDETTLIDIGGSINPIGMLSKCRYVYYTSTIISDTQAHGLGEKDIRYHILKNPNWSKEEKRHLVQEFWADDEDYDEFLEQWEWGIINDYADYNGASELLYKDSLYSYTYEYLLEIYPKEIADIIWFEIEFCKLMHELRPQQWEFDSGKTLEFIPSKK